MLGLRQRLAAVHLFDGLTAEEIEVIFELCEERSFAAGDALFVEGTPADAVWVVLVGDVEISKESMQLAEVGPGSVIGELSLLRHASTRSATVTAICPVGAVRIPTTGFHKLMASSNVGALKVVANIARQIADRLDALNGRMLEPGRKGLTVARGELRRLLAASS